MQEEIKKYMNTYFKAKDNSSLLTEDNKVLLSQVEFYIASMSEQAEIKKLIDEIIDDQLADTKKLGDVKNLAIADDLKQQQVQVRSLVKKEEYPLASKRAAFINIAILLYGIINVGLVLAIALLK